MSKERNDTNGRFEADHGMYQTRFYHIWQSMRARCDKEYCNGYQNYGGSGIGYCEDWKKFKAFYEDMYEGYSDDLSLGRIDSTKGYFKENCRWANTRQQTRNKRDNRMEEIGGVTLCVNDWRHIFGFPISTIFNRLYRGDKGYDLIRPAGVKKVTGSDYGIGDLRNNPLVIKAQEDYL